MKELCEGHSSKRESSRVLSAPACLSCYDRHLCRLEGRKEQNKSPTFIFKKKVKKSCSKAFSVFASTTKMFLAFIKLKYIFGRIL